MGCGGPFWNLIGRMNGTAIDPPNNGGDLLRRQRVTFRRHPLRFLCGRYSRYKQTLLRVARNNHWTTRATVEHELNCVQPQVRFLLQCAMARETPFRKHPFDIALIVRTSGLK
jgi:hypothetical protein